MKHKTILITGGGFIGSNVLRFFVKKNPEYKIFNFDSIINLAAELCINRLTKDKLFYHISTDEVYGTLREVGLSTEKRIRLETMSTI